jgi:hypothetical protein
MPRTHKTTWKRRERDAARLFGAERQPLSGSTGRPDLSRSDSTHGRLFLEVKLRQHHAAVALLDAVRKLARKEGRIPVVALATKQRPGIVLVLDADDLPAVAREYERANALPADCDPPEDWPPLAGGSAEPEDFAR